MDPPLLEQPTVAEYSGSSSLKWTETRLSIDDDDDADDDGDGTLR